jgi:UDP:flavonoid glycosyltransferase YjiC (YdhE family)
MNCLLVTLGGSGDVHPFVGLGARLAARGHTVTILTNELFEPLVRREGLGYTCHGTAEEANAALADPEIWNPRRSAELLSRLLILPAMRPVYTWVAEQVRGPDTVVVAPAISLGACLAHEKLGVPLVTVLLQPAILRSAYDTPVMAGLPLPRHLPRPLKRLAFWVIDRWIVNRLLGPELNAFRRELGLPRWRPQNHWFFSPQLNLGLFPDWLLAQQPDWPPHVYLTGFPLYDERGVAPIPEEVERFLSAGTPPIVITASSNMLHAGAFFNAAVGACKQLGRRGMLLTRYRDQLPAQLPEGVRAFGYVPFSAVLPRSAGIVHHGGIGTAALAMAAGVPQLLTPISHDQPDNAARLARLGVAVQCPANRFTEAEATRLLGQLLASSEIRETCQKIATRFQGRDPLADACSAIERVAAAPGLKS